MPASSPFSRNTWWYPRCSLLLHHPIHLQKQNLPTWAACYCHTREIQCYLAGTFELKITLEKDYPGKVINRCVLIELKTMQDWSPLCSMQITNGIGIKSSVFDFASNCFTIIVFKSRSWTFFFLWNQVIHVYTPFFNKNEEKSHIWSIPIILDA